MRDHFNVKMLLPKIPGLNSQAVVSRCSLKSGALKSFTNFTGKKLFEPFFK